MSKKTKNNCKEDIRGDLREGRAVLGLFPCLFPMLSIHYRTAD